MSHIQVQSYLSGITIATFIFNKPGEVWVTCLESPEYGEEVSDFLIDGLNVSPFAKKTNQNHCSMNCRAYWSQMLIRLHVALSRLKCPMHLLT